MGFMENHLLPTTILKSIIMPIQKDDISFSHKTCEISLTQKGTLIKHIVIYTGPKKHTRGVCGNRLD